MMARFCGRSGVWVFSFLMAVWLCQGVTGEPSPGTPPELQWPRTIEKPGGKISVYQPQILSLKDISLTGRAAVSVTLAGTTNPYFGAVWFAARINTDRQARLVHLEKVFVTKVQFPGADKEQVKALTEILKNDLPREEATLSLDHLLTAMSLAEQASQTEAELSTAPPKIIGVSSPTILIPIDGEPVLKKVSGKELMRVVNTPFALLQDPTSKAFFLRAANKWWTTQDLHGQWQVVETPPADLSSLSTSQAKEVLPASGENAVLPRIIVATEPTELIELWGEADLSFVDDTKLFYVANTNRDILIDGNQMYLLLSGRWFTSALPSGPWTYVAPNQLPEEFKKISPDFERAHVRAHIPGTNEAQEARLDTFIPQTAAIKRGGTTLKVLYDGPPQFDPIEKTSLMYAINTPVPVLQEGDHYFCCYEGVWYEATSAEGPWSVSLTVPADVALIPPSHQLFRVRFVQIYDHTDDTVYEGYTPGYLGCYVQNGIVVFGTGYSYPSWKGSSYYPRQVSYGFNAVYDLVSGVWIFQPPRLGKGKWEGSTMAALEGTTAPWMGSEGWWGAAAYSLFGAHIRPFLVASPDLVQPTTELDNLYQRDKGRLAQSSWGKRLPHSQVHLTDDSDKLPPSGTVTATQEDTQQVAAASEERWDYLKRLSAAEAQMRTDQQAKKEASAQTPKDLYADQDGHVRCQTGNGWKDVDDDSEEVVRDPDLDRHCEARKRGITRRRDLIHSTGSMNKPRDYDELVDTPINLAPNQMFQFLGVQPIPNFGW